MNKYLQLVLLGILLAITCAFMFAVSLPFTRAEFFSVFSEYNTRVWPAQVGLYVLALIAVVLARRRTAVASRGAFAILGILWLWIGAVYHAGFFAAINPAALVFAAAFVIQGFLFMRIAVARNTATFEPKHRYAGLGGWVLLGLSLVLYPVASASFGHVYPAQPTFGLPCPTTIFTLGMLLWASDTAPRHLFAIPVFWSITATVAALQLGVFEDLLLTLSLAIAALAWLVTPGRLAQPRSSPAATDA